LRPPHKKNNFWLIHQSIHDLSETESKMVATEDSRLLFIKLKGSHQFNLEKTALFETGIIIVDLPWFPNGHFYIVFTDLIKPFSRAMQAICFKANWHIFSTPPSMDSPPQWIVTWIAPHCFSQGEDQFYWSDR
jgi:hypothetical protein